KSWTTATLDVQQVVRHPLWDCHHATRIRRSRNSATARGTSVRALSRERPVILFYHRAVLRWHLRAGPECGFIGEISAVELAPDAEFELLETGDDGSLQLVGLAGVGRLLQLLELTDRLVERCHIHTLGRQLPPERFSRGGARRDLSLELARIANSAHVVRDPAAPGGRSTRRRAAVLTAAATPLWLPLVLARLSSLSLSLPRLLARLPALPLPRLLALTRLPLARLARLTLPLLSALPLLALSRLLAAPGWTRLSGLCRLAGLALLTGLTRLAGLLPNLTSLQRVHQRAGRAIAQRLQIAHKLTRPVERDGLLLVASGTDTAGGAREALRDAVQCF